MKDAIMGVAPVYFSRAPTDMGAVGVEACEASLADPALLPEHWMRRASLYNAMAIHQLAAGDAKAALAALDKADQAADPAADMYFQRSVGFNTRLIRGAALIKDGRGEEATKLLMQAWSTRPFNRAATNTVLRSLGSAAPRSQSSVLARRFAQLVPELARTPDFEDVFVHTDRVPDNRYAALLPTFDPAQMMASQQDVETVTRSPKNKIWKRPMLAAKSSIVGMASEGAIVTEHSETQSVNIEVRSPTGSVTEVEELALLKAAELALAAGKSGFAIIKRDDRSYSVTQVYMGMAMNNTPLSQVTKLDVVLSDKALAPGEVRFHDWQVLDAREVKAALEGAYPVYVEPAK